MSNTPGPPPAPPLLERLLGREGERALGSQLYPPRVFGFEGPPNAEQATKILQAITGPPEEVSITRIGGLFVRVPADLSSALDGSPAEPVLGRYSRLIDSATTSFNLVLCELAFEGIISAPASRVEIGPARIVGDHALVVAGGGGRETYTTRTVDMATAVIQGTWPTWSSTNPSLLEPINGTRRALALKDLSPSLPLLVVGAYSNFSRSQLPEAVIDAWIVIEQLLDARWQEYLLSVSDAARAARLRDPRTFSAAVRTEVLQATGSLASPLAEQIHVARKHRNELAHRAVITREAAAEVMGAMVETLQTRLGSAIAHASVAGGLMF